MLNDKEVATNNYSQERRVLVPLTDIYETPDHYMLKLEMPGVAREKLEITMESNELEIRGEVSRFDSKEKDLKYSEFSNYDYYRKFNIGDDVDRDKINAKLENGVLSLELQKHEAVKPKKIPISVQ